MPYAVKNNYLAKLEAKSKKVTPDQIVAVQGVISLTGDVMEGAFHDIKPLGSNIKFDSILGDFYANNLEDLFEEYSTTIDSNALHLKIQSNMEELSELEEIIWNKFYTIYNKNI